MRDLVSFSAFRRLLLAACAALPALAGVGAAAQTLTIESWRNDDADIWNGTIIPAFEENHPGIRSGTRCATPACSSAFIWWSRTESASRSRCC